MSESEQRWLVSAEESGERLDIHLARRLDVTRNQVQRWLREGRVEAAGRSLKASTPVADGMEIRCRPLPPETDPSLEPEPGELNLLYCDEHLVVVDKPAGIAVHPGAGRSEGTLVNRLLHHFPEIASLSGKGRPGIVHRLDLDTTGAVIIARSEIAMRRLQQAFADREVAKTYIALVHGVPSPSKGSVERPIGRHPRDRKQMTIRLDGRPARTSYKTLAHVTERARVAALLEIDLHTGRTHQIRVHMKAISHPLLGDPIYGEARWRSAPRDLRKTLAEFPRPALHAWKLVLAHPITGETLEITAPIPEDFKALWHRLGGGWAFLES